MAVADERLFFNPKEEIASAVAEMVDMKITTPSRHMELDNDWLVTALPTSFLPPLTDGLKNLTTWYDMIPNDPKDFKKKVRKVMKKICSLFKGNQYKKFKGSLK